MPGPRKQPTREQRNSDANDLETKIDEASFEANSIANSLEATCNPAELAEEWKQVSSELERLKHRVHNLAR